MPSQGLVSSILPVHIVAGALALLFGYVALAATKGASLHRKSGLFFVCAMVVMSLTGAWIAILHANAISIVAGLLTFYFVATALLTVRRRTPEAAGVDRLAMWFAIGLAVLGFATGLSMAGTGRPEAYPMFMFGALGLVAARGDRRMIREGGVQGRRRLARHAWRMCFAMWVAAASFFWGPRGRVPEIINFPALFPIAVLLPIAVMALWLWRLRSTRRPRGLAHLDALRVGTLAAPETAAHTAR
jgi:uncharacterized membrane protein